MKLALNKSFLTVTEPSERTLLVAESFGLGIDTQREFPIFDNVELDLRPTDVVFVVGDSGFGKSLLLRMLAERISSIPTFGKVVDLNRTEINPSEILIDGAGSSFESSLGNLCLAGLGDAYLMIRKASELSDGQAYRFKLSKLLDSDGSVWIATDSCSVLDRETAKVVAFCIQKVARRLRKTLIVATTHADLLEDLNPTIVVRKGFGSSCLVEYRKISRSTSECSLVRNVTFREGTREDYSKLHQFHYRSELPGNTYRIFSLELHNELIGSIAYGIPPLACAGRRVFMGYHVPPDQVNKEFINISRVVVHPKYRSIGLGAMLVNKSLPLVSKKYVETMAVMAKFNPFFQKAGMQRVSFDSESTVIYKRQLKALQELGVSLSHLSNIDSMKDEKYSEICHFLATTENFFAIVARYGHEADVDRSRIEKISSQTEDSQKIQFQRFRSTPRKRHTLFGGIQRSPKMLSEKKIERITLEKLHPNSWNPFSMRPELFEALVQHIMKEGLVGQIIVRPCNCSTIGESHFEIIDGENRFLAVQDRRIDLSEIACLIEEKDDVEARIETINFNLEHGEIVREKFDSVINDIGRLAKLSKSDIAAKLYITPEELSMRVAPAPVKAEPSKIQLEARLPTFTISARMHSRKEYEYVDGILKTIMKTEECDEASALFNVFKSYSEGFVAK